MQCTGIFLHHLEPTQGSHTVGEGANNWICFLLFFLSCSTFFLLAVLDLNFYREKGSAIPFPRHRAKSIVWCSRAFQRCCRFHPQGRSASVCKMSTSVLTTCAGSVYTLAVRGLLPPRRSNLYSSRTTKMPHGVTVVLHGIPLGYLRPLSGPVAGAAGEGVVCRKPQQQSIPAKMILCKLLSYMPP